MRSLRILVFLSVGTSLFLPSAALARCRVRNETKYSFTVESGNTSNQRVGAHTDTSIASGKIVGKSDDGKTVGGFCKDGDVLLVQEEKGVPIFDSVEKVVQQ
jgi:hypothetical protein